MSNLMYCADDQLMSRDQIMAVPTPNAMGSRHNPVGYGDFLDLIFHRLDNAGLAVINDEYCTAQENGRFFGTMELGLKSGDGLISSDQMTITLGVRGAHNQSISRGLCIGNRVIVCSNLCFSGDMTNGALSTKQSTNVWDRLPGLVSQAIDTIPALAHREERRLEAYQEHTFTSPRHGDAVLVELYRQQALTAAQLGRAVSEWDHPTYEEHSVNGNTAWKLINAVTESVKPTGTTVNMDHVRERTAKASNFMDSVVGIDF